MNDRAEGPAQFIFKCRAGDQYATAKFACSCGRQLQVWPTI